MAEGRQTKGDREIVAAVAAANAALAVATFICALGLQMPACRAKRACMFETLQGG
jgi:TctA family transporter